MQQLYSPIPSIRFFQTSLVFTHHGGTHSSQILRNGLKYIGFFLLSSLFIHGQDNQEFQVRQGWNQLSPSSETRISLSIDDLWVVVDLDHQLMPRAVSGSHPRIRLGGLNLGTDFRRLANPLGLPISLIQVPGLPQRPRVTPSSRKDFGVAVTLVDLVPSPYSLDLVLGVIPQDMGIEAFGHLEASGLVPGFNLRIRGLMWVWQNWLPGGELDRSLQGARFALHHQGANQSWYGWFHLGTALHQQGWWYGSGLGWRFGQIPRSIPTSGVFRYQGHLWIQGATSGQQGITVKALDDDQHQVTLNQIFDFVTQDVRLEPRIQLRVDSTPKSLELEWVAQLLLQETKGPLDFRVNVGTQGQSENLYGSKTRDWQFKTLGFNLEPWLGIPFGSLQLNISLEAKFQVNPGFQSRDNELIKGDLPVLQDPVTIYGLELKSQNPNPEWRLIGKLEIHEGLESAWSLKPRFDFSLSVELPKKVPTNYQILLGLDVSYRMSQAMDLFWFRGLNPGFFLSSPGNRLGILEVQWTLNSKRVLK